MNYKVYSARIGLFILFITGLTFIDYYAGCKAAFDITNPYAYQNNYAYTIFFPLTVLAGLVMVIGGYLDDRNDKCKI